MSNVINIRTRRPMRGYSKIEDVFGASLPGDYWEYIEAMLQSKEMVHISTVYGWTLRWKDVLDLDVDKVKHWWYGFVRGCQPLYENDAVFELTNYGKQLMLALKYKWDTRSILREHLLRDVRIVRDDLESIAMVHPQLRSALDLMDRGPGIERIPNVSMGEFIQLDLTRRYTPDKWWGSRAK